MSSRKRALAALLAILATAGMSGCMLGGKRSSAEQLRTQALEYLADRYSDAFTAIGYSSADWAYPYESIRFSCEKFPDAVVEVRACKNEDGNYLFKDNYYQCCMMDDAVAYCTDSAGLEQIHVKVRFSNAVWSDDLKDAQTFADWLSLGNCRLDVFVISSDALLPETQIAYVEQLASDRIAGSVSFITTDDRDLLAGKPLDEILNRQSEYVIEKTDYFINSNFEVETD